ncbi:Ubiquinone/menaquinone biosynthesis-related protein [Taphrina deformans PYCC 5710]|uniref:Ubiquinone/menaquinone biosynthesis-related protein n=1 Tax=Taphrina deformans (strain PYCC 5710 / ATCC 11124 / CBS 356.35 / IMI 108563 / JCM 9778 / NBRC 8474) TaxID=1097556 RepID=R4XH76_TAPDE|nr:Ubiquinone/menaquinone biosynthesis-related protein [Taphrina deformans PYCC 5710]|eukprot:CCG85142.1 Ubiquinone/menaquinone biosynthesis-related protein [Taphrina deformans PYCC 5710]
MLHSSLRPLRSTVKRGFASKNARKTPVISNLQPGPSTRRSRLPLYVGGLLVYGASIYVGSAVYRVYYPNPSAETSSSNICDLSAHRPEVYDEIASTYDTSISLDETLMGLGWLRWNHIKDVSGDVLEVSAGTGRNLSYYDADKVKSLTLVDQSSPMLDVAREKAARDTRWRKSGVQVQFKDVAVEGLSPNRDNYDVIVQTFGLCSVSNPVSYLSHLSKFCRSGGEIILLEHGRGTYGWINRLLDNNVSKHAEKWGCFYNRDIQNIVESCPDVEIVSVQRWHFGTTSIYHLRPKH